MRAWVEISCSDGTTWTVAFRRSVRHCARVVHGLSSPEHCVAYVEDLARRLGCEAHTVTADKCPRGTFKPGTLVAGGAL